MPALDGMIVPAVLAVIVAVGLLRRVDLFDAFLEGAREGIQTTLSLLPTLIAVFTAIGMLRASGLLDLLVGWLAPFCRLIGFPAELTPLALLRPISGSGSLAVLGDLLGKYGADTTIGRIASVLQSSTETTFYTVAVYYGAVGVTRTRYTLPCALAADFAGIVLSAAVVRLFF